MKKFDTFIFLLTALLLMEVGEAFAETNLEKLKSMRDKNEVLISVNNREIPASPRVLKGLYDEEKFGDWFLDVYRLDVKQDAGSLYIPDGNIVHIYTFDPRNKNNILGFTCRSALVSEGGSDYSVLAGIRSYINPDGKIKDFSKYFYILDSGEGKMQDSVREMDSRVSLGSTSGHVINFINEFKVGREFYGMLDVDSSKQVFKFSLKGFKKSYSEMTSRCLKFSYVTYNRVFR